MTIYLKLKMKDLLTNPELLGWGIGFIEFWVLMWIFVFTKGPPKTIPLEYFASVNASMAFGFLGLLSMASVAIGLAYSIFHQSRAARYLTKFTKLSPRAFLLEDFFGSLVTLLIFIAVIYASIIAANYAKFGVFPVLKNPIGVFVDLVISGVALYWFAYALALTIIVTRRTRAISMVSFIPLVIAFIAYSQLWVDFKSLVYVIPLSTIPSLLMYHATGMVPPTGSYLAWLFGSEPLTSINLRLAAISLFAWIVIFIAISLVMLRKSRGIPLEEIRF
ncbi:MAG: hypothetical protein DRJ60_04630 [Thermoprotei archaeon]|nr:MAG: hypothetical protein DRJ60_04630 [Thermoprotei archaeon]